MSKSQKKKNNKKKAASHANGITAEEAGKPNGNGNGHYAKTDADDHEDDSEHEDGQAVCYFPGHPTTLIHAY